MNKLWHRLQSGHQYFLQDFMVTVCFQYNHMRLKVILNFSFLHWKKPPLHATFTGFKSELVMLENVIHFTKSHIVQALKFINKPIWPLQILKKRKCS